MRDGLRVDRAQREIALALPRGGDPATFATVLHPSVWTDRDHLKAISDTSGARSRRAFVLRWAMHAQCVAEASDA